MFKRRKDWLCFLFLLAVFMTVPCVKAGAAPAKTKALKAYGEFLSKKTVRWDSYYDKLPAKECRFAVAYIDKDNIPELILYNTNVTHVSRFGRLYTYKNGKVKCVGAVDIDGGKCYYYKKKGIFVGEYVMGGISNAYLKLSNGKISSKLVKRKKMDGVSNGTYYYDPQKEITKSSFNKRLKSLVGTTKRTTVKFYKNTGANRKKILRVKAA